MPYFPPLLAYQPKAREHAAMYNCSGTHWPGHIAPYGFDASLAGVPWASMSLNSNGVLSALNLIAHWEYTRDRAFLADVAFPFCRDALAFYQCWMERSADGTSWQITRDQAHECNPGVPVTEAGKQLHCYQNNSAVANGFVRRVARALPSMAAALGEPVDPEWAEIAEGLVPLPTDPRPGQDVFVLAGERTDVACAVPKKGEKGAGQLCGIRQPGHMHGGPHFSACTACVAQPSGSMAVGTWHIFPGESTSLASPEALRTTSINTLENDAGWSQGNSFCCIYSQAARVGMPLPRWLPQWHKLIQQTSLPNFIPYQGGGGVEVAGALQAIADLMLQSVTQPDTSGQTMMILFPLGVNHTDITFHRLRGKGGFIVSASWSKDSMRLSGAVSLHSEKGEPCRIMLPPTQTGAVRVEELSGSGGRKQVAATRQGQLVAFNTSVATDYVLTAQ